MIHQPWQDPADRDKQGRQTAVKSDSFPSGFNLSTILLSSNSVIATDKNVAVIIYVQYYWKKCGMKLLLMQTQNFLVLRVHIKKEENI